MDMPYRTFSNLYRGQMIDVLVVCLPGMVEVADFIIQVTVTLHKKAVSAAINICDRGYESYDEAHHAGVLVGQGMIDNLKH